MALHTHLPSTARSRYGRNGELLALWRRHQKEAGAADAIYETLREGILRGLLPPGERLGELQLAKLFKRSRTPIREAILRLESERLAERSARRGLVVGRISREEILEVYAVREVLDGLAARLAAQAILPADLEHLRWLNRRLRDAAKRRDFAAMVDLNIEFHEGLCRASRNSLLAQFVGKIHDWVRRFPETTFARPGRALEAVSEHEQLLDALRKRDSDAAERIARQHMAGAMKARVSMLRGDLG